MLILTVQIILFAHLVWLSFYLQSRARESKTARFLSSGVGLLAFGLVLNSVLWDPSDVKAFGAIAIMYVLWSLGSMAMGLAMALGIVRQDDPTAYRRLQVLVILFTFVPAAAILVLLSNREIAISWIYFAILGCVYLVAGIGASKRISDERGEALLPDLIRSYDYSFLISVVFGGQVIIAMWIGPGATTPMIGLLLGTITAAIAIQVFLERVQAMLDRIAFANVPWLRQERASLREIENLLPRVNMTDPLTIPEEEFSKLTRRALSNYGDLTKLATSPLTNLPEVHRRLQSRGVEPATLERARELKVLLAEAIERLKPINGDEIGTTDEWRFYNALYYPYIVGMRPYSTTAVHSFDVPAYYDVLDWFRTYVPERTLYNWQNAAAALIAGHLREQEEIAVSPEPASTAELTPIR